MSRGDASDGKMISKNRHIMWIMEQDCRVVVLSFACVLKGVWCMHCVEMACVKKKPNTPLG